MSPGEVGCELIVNKYLAVEGLSLVAADQLGQLFLVVRPGSRLVYLVCWDDKGTLDTSVAIQELGQGPSQICQTRNIIIQLSVSLHSCYSPGARITSTSRERV